uniref:Uncharacterized protein n=1 Tax=Siphoviridae sp. ct1is2 TaxID=2826273 RepID=A0A8S5NMB3_9CAUD|nr:MAG TPA: hypothetical protein [Siphoviridae sp. ct1is2]
MKSYFQYSCDIFSYCYYLFDILYLSVSGPLK